MCVLRDGVVFGSQRKDLRTDRLQRSWKDHIAEDYQRDLPSGIGEQWKIDSAPAYENPSVKKQCFFMTEEVTFFQQATLEDMRKFYRGYYASWSDHHTGS